MGVGPRMEEDYSSWWGSSQVWDLLETCTGLHQRGSVSHLAWVQLCGGTDEAVSQVPLPRKWQQLPTFVFYINPRP